MSDSILRRFSIRELRAYNGKKGRGVYVVYKGLVYDLSLSMLWDSGSHVEEHHSGEDLSEALEGAPHGEELIKLFPVVGRLKD